MSLVINGSGSITGLAVGGLPDGTVDAGTLATDSVTAAKLEVSAITGADLPAGSVLQVIYSSTTTKVTNASTTAVDSGLSATITPSATTSKILVIHSTHFYLGTGASELTVLLSRGSDVRQTYAYAIFDATNVGIMGALNKTYLDTPSTTSATTYKTLFRAASGTVSSNYDDSGGDSISTITLMEIAG